VFQSLILECTVDGSTFVFSSSTKGL